MPNIYKEIKEKLVEQKILPNMLLPEVADDGLKKVVMSKLLAVSLAESSMSLKDCEADDQAIANKLRQLASDIERFYSVEKRIVKIEVTALNSIINGSIQPHVEQIRSSQRPKAAASLSDQFSPATPAPQ